jgi:hypothetical protein
LQREPPIPLPEATVAIAFPQSARERELVARLAVIEEKARRQAEASLTARLHLSMLDLGGTDGRIVQRVMQVLKEVAEVIT